jgi:energy-converting hydrogenase Eha subunit A
MNSGLYILLCSLALVAWFSAKLVRRLPRVPPPGDPVRFLWAQVVVYLTAFVILAATVIRREWGVSHIVLSMFSGHLVNLRCA